MEIDEENNENKGGMWDLEQKLDQPMDEEAGRLRNMYREKVTCTFLLCAWNWVLRNGLLSKIPFF